MNGNLQESAAETKQGRLHGKIALVTGAGCVGPGWGNGRAIAWRFAQEGAQVVAVDRDRRFLEETIDLVAKEGRKIDPMECDVTDAEAVEQLFADVEDRFGRIDILVNNVGGTIAGGLLKLTRTEWDSQIALNLTSVYTMSRRAALLMQKSGGGSIVNVASTSAIRWTGAPQIGYAAAKAGVVQFGRVAAVELAPHGIRINSILPGQLHTPLVDAVLAKDQSGGDVEELLQRRRRRIPLGIDGDGRDTANAALFLASDEARFITGTELVVDGGMIARCD